MVKVMTKEAEELRWEHEVLQQKYNEVSRERDEIQVYKQMAGTLIKKLNEIFLIYKEILKGAVAKSFVRKVFLIYVEMRKFLVIYEEAISYI
jgi:hypothetical protein